VPGLLETNKAYSSVMCDTASWWASSYCEKRYALLSLAVSDCKRLDTSLYLIITNFHTELNLR